MEKAVVASNVGWGPELVNDGVDGLLANPKDHDQFTEHIIALVNNPDRICQLGKNARKSAVNKFSNTVIAAESLEFYTTYLR
jgi:starch synthase